MAYLLNFFKVRICLLIFIAIVSTLLFIYIGKCIFLPGLNGFIIAAINAFGRGLMGAVARARRPSWLWRANPMGLLLGVILSIAIIRKESLQPHHYWNQWSVVALPVAAFCGSVVASVKTIKRAFDIM
jgi:hypothetical protein